MIYLAGQESASNADLLAGTRLSAIPYSGGVLTIQAQGNTNVAASGFLITIQLPDGSNPVEAQPVSAGDDNQNGGQLDDRYLDQWSFPAPQGGHFTIAFTEVGIALVTWRVVLRP